MWWRMEEVSGHKVASDPHFRKREEGGFSHLRKGTSQRESERLKMPPVSLQPHSAPSFSFWNPHPHRHLGSGFRDSV